MKRLIHILFSVALSLPAFATVRIASNFPSPQAQFSTIQAACDASNSGDSIYVLGSPIDYSYFTINNKKLAVFGPGWNPDKESPSKVVVPGCALSGAGASGSELHGIYFTSTVSVQTIGIMGLKFLRNRFSSGQAVALTPAGSGNILEYFFEGNWFDNGYISSNGNYSLSDFLFKNNIFYDNQNGTSISGFTNSQNIVFDHNLWLGNSSNYSCFSGCRFLTLSNNIFIHRNAGANNSFSSFNNNVAFNTGTDAPWIVNGNFDGGGNLSGVDPQMANQVNVNNGENNPLLDFSISSGPANNAGSDTKDIGLLFDQTGSANWRLSRGAHLPFISKMKINTPSVVSGSNISVSIEAKRN